MRYLRNTLQRLLKHQLCCSCAHAYEHVILSMVAYLREDTLYVDATVGYRLYLKILLLDGRQPVKRRIDEYASVVVLCC